MTRILRFSLTSANPGRLAKFYESAFGFEQTDILTASAEPYGVTGAVTLHRLRLGAQEIELAGFAAGSAPYPADSTSHDGWFQHLALVAPDMRTAFTALQRQSGWQPITRGGQPVQLPPGSGGVAAFKFRDPEGHPLELLAFPASKTPAAWTQARFAGPVVGIDHSAIVVSDSQRSLTFYEALGFAVSSRSSNQGPEQEALDNADAVRVDVTGLSLPEQPPHLEFLAYRHPGITAGAAAASDVACTRLVLTDNARAPDGKTIRDPDGHRLILGGPSR